MDFQSDDGCWVWVSFAPEHRLLLAIHAGPRNQKSADVIVKQTGERIDETKLPLFVSDGMKAYGNALLKRYHSTIEFARTGKRGRPRISTKVPHPDLKYAQMVKSRVDGRIVRVEKRIIFGKKESIPVTEICTSYIERQNLTLRQDNNRLTRKTLGYSKDDVWLGHQTTFYMAYFNFVRTHHALRIPVKIGAKENMLKKFQKRTPMMSAGITDHIWALRELLRYSYHKMSTD